MEEKNKNSEGSRENGKIEGKRGFYVAAEESWSGGGGKVESLFICNRSEGLIVTEKDGGPL